MSRWLTPLLALLLAALGGCTGLTERAPTPTGTPTEPPAPAPVRNFEKDSLFALLKAELGLHRNQYRLALGHYLHEAQVTRDPRVAERATEIAFALQAREAARDTATLWAELEPDHPQARYLAGLALAQTGQGARALEHMLRSHALGGETRFALAAARLNGPEAQRRALRQLIAVTDAEPDNLDAWLAQAILWEKQDEPERGLKAVRKALTLEPNLLQGAVLEARLLIALDRHEEAFARFEAILDRYPNNKRLQVEYVRALTQVDLVQAQEAFTDLLQRYPNDPALLLGQGLVAFENRDTDTARRAFEALLGLGRHTDQAHYFLGDLAANAGDIELAIQHFRAVSRDAGDFLPARDALITLLLQEGRFMAALHQLREDRLALEQASPDKTSNTLLALIQMEAELLMQRDKLEDSLNLLNTSIRRYGPDYQLLYTRSLVNEKRGDLAAVEQDLRDILARNPESSATLNALGYSLTNLSNRHEEALDLIERALELDPDNPAIIDSLGWVHYHLGDTRKALRYLEDAYALMPDPEVGAHLGEVYWVLGRKVEALNVWRAMHEQAPKHPVLTETVHRLTGHPPDALFQSPDDAE